MIFPSLLILISLPAQALIHTHVQLSTFPTTTMNWQRSLFGFRLGSQDNSESSSSTNLPGHFPSDQEAQNQGSSARVTFNTISGTVNYIVIKPIAMMLTIALGIFGRFLSLLYFRDLLHVRSTSVNNALINDPIRRVEQFVLDLEENLLPQQQFSTHHSDHSVALPPFFQGSYTQALYMATSRGKFLFIYLTNPQNDGALSIFQRIVTNQKFISMFTSDNDQNIIWGADVTNPEAYQLANSLNITKFPVLGLLCLARTTTMTPEGPKKTAPRISLILKIQGGLPDGQDADALIYSKFIKRMMKYEPELALIRSELREKYISDMMRRKQDMDYNQSLLRDQQKKLERERKALGDKYLSWRQPQFYDLMKSNDRVDKAKIAIRMADGSRETVLFPKDGPVEDVFVFVELKNRGMLNDRLQSNVSEQEAHELFDDFHMSFDFNLVSSVPPRPCLNDLSPQTTIEQVDYIYPSGLLLVDAK